MTVEQTLESYYDSLRDGAPLEPYFSREIHPVKFGISEELDGYEDIAKGLRAQTRTTTDWEITSHNLQTDSKEGIGWFSDLVAMQWRNIEEDRMIRWNTRWSGTLLEEDSGWTFVRMHVSAAEDSV